MKTREFSIGATIAFQLAATAVAGTLLAQKQAIELAFPAGTRVERKTSFLTDEQLHKAQELGRAPVDSHVWTYYIGVSTGGVIGYAYFETHTVRTMPETFMAVLDAKGQLRFVELLAFHEPEDYQPSVRWLDQFKGKSLKDDLFVRRGIRNITGASLTSAALTDGIRRILAIHSVLHREGGGK